MKITDSHLHLWDPAVLRYDWLQAVPEISEAQLPAQRFADDGDLQAAIVVQADCDPQQAVEEARWIVQLAPTAPFTLAGIVAHIALNDPGLFSAQLAELQRIPQVVGVRHSLQNEEIALFYHPDYRQRMATVARSGLTLDLCVRAHQLAAAGDLLDWLFRQVPEARVVLDHQGKPNIAQQQWQAWQQDFDRLAALEGLWCKISGLPTEADWQRWQDEELLPWISHAVAQFGPRRCMFGGDWPVVKLAGGYSRWKRCVMKAIAQLSAAAQQDIMANNALAFYLRPPGEN